MLIPTDICTLPVNGSAPPKSQERQMKPVDTSSNDAEMEDSKEVDEFLQNLLLVRKAHALLYCGSSLELPFQYVLANATDVDMMYVPTNICALPVSVSEPENFHGKKLVVNTEETYPGFARLYSPDRKRLYRSQKNGFQRHYKNGPAWTKLLIFSKHIDLINLVCKHLGRFQYREIQRRLLEMKTDRVFAICCPCWPPEADEWKTRGRPNGWPIVKIINKIVASGCYFVSKPHHSSPDDDTQWRFSFSQAEVILIHSWTDVQKYIYHILRLIKSDVVKDCGGSDETIICTYFFKTLMFWECERKPKAFWEDENVEKSVGELLCIMIEWLIDGCCPNYFIPKCNMISAATERVDFTQEIQLLLIYTESCILHQITAMWPKAYPKHTIDPMQIDLPDKLLLHHRVMQVRDNHLNPLYPNMKTHLLKQLTGKNSLLWRQVCDLYRGLQYHIQVMKTSCPVRKCYLKRMALSHLMSSLMDNGEECSTRMLSISESIYEWEGRFIRETDCEIQSRGTHKDIHRDSRLSGNSGQSSFNTPAKRNSKTGGRFLLCYSRRMETGENNKESKLATNVATDDLNRSIKALAENMFANGIGNATVITRVISLAYLANFYYTALQDCTKAAAVCDTVIKFPAGTLRGDRMNRACFERSFPIFITNKLSPLFDEHFRTVLGLITLYRSIVDSPQNNSTVLVRICPAQFLKYLRIRCKRWEGADEPEISENFECKHAFNEAYDTYEPLSEVFMSAVLHASRCQFS